MSARLSKRRRSSETPTEVSHNIDSHKLFERWSQDRGVEINGVESAVIENSGLGLVTTKKLEEGERILIVPEKAMFKPDSRLMKRESLEHASPQAQLATSAMKAFNASNSNFKVWQDTWPTTEDFAKSMPMFWEASLRKLLPSSIQQPLARQEGDYLKDWTAVKSFCVKHDFTESDFKYFWTIVNSRSFYWKALRAKAGGMVMCPFIDYLNHGPTGTGCLVSMTGQGYEVTTTRDYDIGEEVLVTYAAYSNDKLLVHYGFVCGSDDMALNNDDDIRLDHLILPKLIAEIQQQLQDVGFLGPYSLLPASNELCFKTQVAVRAVLLTCNEWEHFITTGEDLAGDYSSDVNDFIKGLLGEYRSEASRMLEVAAASGSGRASKILTERWTQIRDAIDAFVES